MKEFIVPTLRAWEEVPRLAIDCFPWPEYRESIHTSVKLMQSESALLVRFETDERPLLAEKTADHSRVCEDSCMEFFFRSAFSVTLATTKMATAISRQTSKNVRLSLIL